jgi:hypothetical protein
VIAAPIRRALVALLAAALAGTVAAPGPSAAAAPPGADMTGTGPQPKALGLGSKAALAQDRCDEATGHTDFVSVGTGPFCVSPWPKGKDNGGATAPGVTATSVKVVVLIPNEQMSAQSASTGAAQPKNQATGETATMDKALEDYNTVYEYAIQKYGTYQTWGRTPEIEYVTASGSDETAQRADVLEVVARKPFMVLDQTGGDVFETAIASRKILVFGGAGDNEAAAEQSPYRWIQGSDPDASVYLTASFLGRSLSGEKAKWAGDENITTQTRSFGVVYPETGVDVDVFKAQLKKAGSTPVAQAVSYDNSDPSRATEGAPTIITKMKSAGVTSVVLFTTAPVMKALMASATNQDYRPEWIITGYQYHDWDGYGRGNDQSQMSHAFGVGILPPAYEGSSDITGVFQWYWGDHVGNYGAAQAQAIGLVYGAMQYAGPTLTAANVKKGLFAVPAGGGAATGTTIFQAGYGRTVRLPYDEYGVPGTDRTLAWWNPDITGGTNAVRSIVGKGKLMYLDGGKRYAYGEFPKKQPAFFDASASVSEIPTSSAFRGGVVPAPNPCPECPVNGGNGLAQS